MIEWLSELKDLKKLNIEENNFDGIIPAKILLYHLLKLYYLGIPCLCMNKT
jgi:hypothetical protein